MNEENQRIYGGSTLGFRQPSQTTMDRLAQAEAHFTEQLEKAKKAQRLLAQNPEFAELLDITRELGI